MYIYRYDTTMYALSGIMGLAAVTHLLVKPLTIDEINKLKALNNSNHKQNTTTNILEVKAK